MRKARLDHSHAEHHGELKSLGEVGRKERDSTLCAVLVRQLVRLSGEAGSVDERLEPVHGVSIGVRLALVLDGARELGEVLKVSLSLGRVLVAQPFPRSHSAPR